MCQKLIDTESDIKLVTNQEKAEILKTKLKEWVNLLIINVHVIYDEILIFRKAIL